MHFAKKKKKIDEMAKTGMILELKAPKLGRIRFYC